MRAGSFIAVIIFWSKPRLRSGAYGPERHQGDVFQRSTIYRCFAYWHQI